MQPAVAPRYYSVAQVAELLTISRMQVYRLISSGRLTAFNFGNKRKQGSWHVSPADLEAFERAACNNPTTPRR